MARRSWTVVGVGGVGGYYGSRLALAGFDVQWVARSDADHLRTEGLVVTSPNGDAHLSDLWVTGPGEPIAPTDVVVVSTKTIDNDRVAEWLAGELAGRSSIVVVLQNGLDVERAFAERLAVTAPDVVVVGAMSFICSTKEGPGRVTHLSYERVEVGAWSADGVPPSGGPGSAAVAAVVEDLSAAGVTTQALDDLVVGRWRKLMWNIPFNGLSVVLDASTEEMVGDPSCRIVVRDLMTEVLSASVGTGHPVDPSAIDQLFAATEQMVSYAPSMKVDFDAGRPLELEALYATPLRIAQEASVRMPRTEALWRQLAFLDRRNVGER